MKCEKCEREIQANENYYTAIGVVQCEECNLESKGTISLDFILDKIIKESKEE